MGNRFNKDAALPEVRPFQTTPGIGPLHLAVAEGKTAQVRQLCSKSSTNVNHAIDGVTPLMVALDDSIDTEIVRELLRCSRLDVNQPHTQKQFTPLMLAVLVASKSNRKTIIYKKIELLTAHKQCKLGLRNEDGITALELAAKIEDASLVKFLIKGDRLKQYDMQDVLGACLLAFKSGNDELIHAIMDNVPQTVLAALLAALKQYAEDKPEDSTSSATDKQSRELTALHKAVIKESVSEVKHILDQSSTDVNAEVGGLTPLMLASCGRNPAIVKLLLTSSRIDVNARSSAFKKMTALMMSIFACGGASDAIRITIINQLLAHPKCDFTFKDEDHTSALGMASIFGYTDAADCLLRERRAEKYAAEDFVQCVVLALVTENKDLAKHMCGKVSAALQAKILEKLPQLANQTAEVARQLTAHVELGKSLNHTVKSFRLGKPVNGSIVRIAKDEQFVKGKQAERNLMYDSAVLNRVGIFRKFLSGGNAEITRSLNSNSDETLICHPDILSVVSRDGYEGTDEDGNLLIPGDVVKVTVDLDSLKLLQKGHGGIDDDHRAALGKFGHILFFDVDGDALVTVGSSHNCLNMKALRKVTTITSGDGSPVKVGDQVLVLHSETTFKGLQTLEFGGWTSSMSRLIGKTLTISKFCCSFGDEPQCMLKVEYDSKVYRLNPKVVGLTEFSDAGNGETIVPVPRPKGEKPASSEGSVTLQTDKTAGSEIQLINRKDLKLGRKLGNGGFGMVYLANWCATQCAVKRIVSAAGVIEGEEKQRLLEEARIHSRLKHPHVVQFLGLALDEIDIFLVLNVVHGHNLEEIIFGNKMALSETEKRTICTQTADVMRYFHDVVGVIHQDMKPSNVMVDAMTKHAFVTDFGISRMKGRSAVETIQQATQQYTTQLAGTIYYMAPELFITSTVGENKFRKHTRESDVYSLGMTLVEFLGNIRFYEAADLVSIVQMKMKPGIPASVRRVPSAFRVILTKCVQHTPNDRPTAGAVAEYFLHAA